MIRTDPSSKATPNRRPVGPLARRSNPALFGAGLLASIGMLALLDLVSTRVVAGNSDGATVVLEGKALSDGQLLLHGWELSLDSFWTIDATINAVVERVVGLRPWLLNFVPALIATLVIVLGISLARTGQRRANVVGGLTVLGLLAFPGRAFANFFLQGPLHVATALWGLVALALLCPPSSDRLRPAWFSARWALAVIFLAAGLLGDLQALALGVVPIGLAGLLAMARQRDWRAGRSPFSAALCSAVLALLVHELARAAGGFTLGVTNPTADRADFLSNLSYLPSYVAGLFGTDNGPYGPSGLPQALADLHALVLVVVLASIAWTLVNLCKSTLTSRPLFGPAKDALLIDDALLIALVGSLATYLILPTTVSPAYSRYLTAAIIFASVLAGRNLGRLSTALRAPVRRARLGPRRGGRRRGDRGRDGLQPATPSAPTAGARLSQFLLAHHLRQGVGDYWSASITTVESAGAVEVRPVVATVYGRLVRYAKQSADDWYRDQRFNFVVFNTVSPYGAVDLSTATTSFGPPQKTYAVGPYRVLVFEHPFIISLQGSIGGA